MRKVPGETALSVDALAWQMLLRWGEDEIMSWAFGFLLLACLSGIVAFGGIATGPVTAVAWVLFAVFILLMIRNAVARVIRRSDLTRADLGNE